MLLKSADNKEERIAELETLLASASADKLPRIQQEIVSLNTDIRREIVTAQYINFHYEKDENWLVFHDLWLEANGWVAQIDLLMINRSLDCYVFDTKQFNSRLKITDDGAFLRWNETRQKHETVPSPLLQNDRNMPVLKEVLAEVFTPERVGKRIKPALHPMVLVSATSFIERPRHFDTRKVIQADRLKSVIESRGVLKALGSAKQVDSGTLSLLGHHLLAMHRPIRINYRALFGLEDVEMSPQSAPQVPAKDAQATPPKGNTTGGLKKAPPMPPVPPPTRHAVPPQPVAQDASKPPAMRLSQSDPQSTPKAPPKVPPMPPKGN
jgi:hypothetical protein